MTNAPRTIAMMCAVACLVGCTKGAEMSVASDAAASASSPAASSKTPTMQPYADTAPSRLGQLAPGTGIPVGSKVPDVHARTIDGADVALSSLYGKGPILLVFYRGGWCPYCSTENHSLSVAYPDFQKRGVTPVTISVDKPEAEAKTKATYAIPFPVLSDTDAVVLEAFHVVNNVDDATLAKMKEFGVDLESYSGKPHHKIAIPSLFLIDRTGTVRWAHSDPDFKVRPSIAQILAAIDAAHLGS